MWSLVGTVWLGDVLLFFEKQILVACTLDISSKSLEPAWMSHKNHITDEMEEKDGIQVYTK